MFIWSMLNVIFYFILVTLNLIYRKRSQEQSYFSLILSKRSDYLTLCFITFLNIVCFLNVASLSDTAIIILCFIIFYIMEHSIHIITESIFLLLFDHKPSLSIGYVCSGLAFIRFAIYVFNILFQTELTVSIPILFYALGLATVIFSLIISIQKIYKTNYYSTIYYIVFSMMMTLFLLFALPHLIVLA